MSLEDIIMFPIFFLLLISGPFATYLGTYMRHRGFAILGLAINIGLLVYVTGLGTIATPVVQLMLWINVFLSLAMTILVIATADRQ